MMILSEFITFYKSISHFDRTLQIEIVGDTLADIHIACQISNEHLSSPQTAHGGALAGLMDATLGIKTLAYAVERQKLCSTVEFKINFLRPVKLGDQLRGRADFVHLGQSLVVTSGHLLRLAADGTEECVATGLGTFNLYPMEKKFS